MNTDHPSNTQSRSAGIIATAVIGLIIATVAIVLRFWSRKISKAGFYWDDWFALASLPSAYCVSVVLIYASTKGLGRHAEEIASMPGGDAPFAEQLGYIAAEIYNIGITFVKLSGLFFYERVFGRVKGFHLALVVTGVLCVIWMIVTTLVSFFSCFPNRRGWTVTGGHSGDNCLDRYAGILGTSIVNVLLDVVILILPHFQLWRLQMGKRRKLALVGVFLCGYSVVAISLVRMLAATFLEHFHSPDRTFQLTVIVIPYALEIPVGILTICLFSIVQFARRWQRSGFGSLFRPHDSAAAAATAAIQEASLARSTNAYDSRREGFQRLESG